MRFRCYKGRDAPVNGIPQFGRQDGAVGEVECAFLCSSRKTLRRGSEYVFAQGVADEPLPSRENRPSTDRSDRKGVRK